MLLRVVVRAGLVVRAVRWGGQGWWCGGAGGTGAVGALAET
ncbi:hypothetical protein [Oerskovia douganii]|nr:hypothetical protein [Oerskovia douganii]